MPLSGYGPDWSAGFRRGEEVELEGWLDFAIGICAEADDIARRWFRRDLDVASKPDGTFVTEADREIERLIRERVTDAHPDHGIFGEEYGAEGEGASVRWIVDPIDGTHNFMRGIPLFGTLLALERDGEIQLGVMSAPAHRERWSARRGGGAWADGLDGRRRISVSRVARLEDAQVLFGSATDNRRSGLMPGFDALVGAAWRERGFGDFWGYALVAEGAAEVMIETGLSPWDAAAPLVIIEEAGGRVTGVDGKRGIDGTSFVGSNGAIHEIVLERLTAPA